MERRRRQRSLSRHTVDNAAATTSRAVAVVGGGVSAVRAQRRDARVRVRGAEAAEPRRHLRQTPEACQVNKVKKHVCQIQCVKKERADCMATNYNLKTMVIPLNKTRK